MGAVPATSSTRRRPIRSGAESFSAGGWIDGPAPVVRHPRQPAEYSGSTLTPYWRTRFEFPDNGPSGTGPVYDALKETVFYADYQGVRFVSLNSDTSGPYRRPCASSS